jgi:hypothetical protein
LRKKNTGARSQEVGDGRKGELRSNKDTQAAPRRKETKINHESTLRSFDVTQDRLCSGSATGQAKFGKHEKGIGVF